MNFGLVWIADYSRYLIFDRLSGRTDVSFRSLVNKPCIGRSKSHRARNQEGLLMA